MRVGGAGARRVLGLTAGVAALLAIALTGATLSPLLPLLALWVWFAAAAVRRPVAIAVACLGAITAIHALVGDVRLEGMAAAAIVASLCMIAGRANRFARPTVNGRRGLDPFEQATTGASPARSVADLRAWLDARGAALWWLDPRGGRARLACAAGRRPPSALDIDGSPLGWVAATGTPMQIEPPPDWVEPASLLAAARVPAFAADETLFLLTLELPRSGEPSRALLACAAAVMAAAIDGDHQRQLRAAELDRGERLMAALRELPNATSPSEYAEQLLDTACTLTGASGAVLASWQDGEGSIAHQIGYDGGPATGDRIDAPGSDMALAARSQSTIRRDVESPAELPLAHAAEAWRRPPALRATLPLWTGGTVTGVIAVWNAEPTPLDDAGLRMLETIARVCGAHFDALTGIGRSNALADHDALTGLLNRRAFERHFEREVARAERYGRPIALIAIDIDHFKAINDAFGHEAGDLVLRRVAHTLQATIRDSDLAARVGGEEFLVLLPETGLHAAQDAAERLRTAVAGLAMAERTLPASVRISLGVSSLPECVVLPSRLRSSSDEALYEAKRAGRDRVVAAPAWLEKTAELR